MTLQQLDLLIPKLLAKHGDMEIAIDFASFTENENGAILTVKDAEVRQVQGADDSGPVGPKFPFLVLTGECTKRQECPRWFRSSARFPPIPDTL